MLQDYVTVEQFEEEAWLWDQIEVYFRQVILQTLELNEYLPKGGKEPT